jgi:hypothetical protein
VFGGLFLRLKQPDYVWLAQRASAHLLRPKRRATSSSAPLALCPEKFDQPGRIRAEPFPRRPELAHAVLSICAGALRVDLPHRNDGVDRPDPVLGRTAAALDTDLADLGLEAVILEDDAVVVVGLGMDHFAQVKVHGPY